ncbi:MAG TPA: metallophosphoesterase [Baekduia sp.]|nr:metallophosphoesterase [Baekduia sp.]
MRRRRRPSTLLAAAVAVAAGTALHAVVIGPRRTVVRRVDLRLPRWPADLDGLTVALVGDLHAGVPHVDVARVRDVAGRIARRRPDVVLCAGDLMDDHAHGALRLDPHAVAAALAGAGAPRLAVLGNHDRIFGAEQVAAALRSADFALLEDDARRLTVRGRALWIAGAADAASAEPRPGRALRDVPLSEPVLLLTHSPDVFPAVPERVALTLAGHTHGGQVAAPGPVRARIIPSRFGTRYDRGHVVEGARHLFVTSGVGTSGWPVRLGIAPEVVLLRLRSTRTGRPRRLSARRAAGR